LLLLFDEFPRDEIRAFRGYGGRTQAEMPIRVDAKRSASCAASRIRASDFGSTSTCTINVAKDMAALHELQDSGWQRLVAKFGEDSASGYALDQLARSKCCG